MTTPLRKYPFWSKKGKPTKGESKILNEIKKLCKKHKISEADVVSKFGLVNDELSLNQLFANINDEVSKNSSSAGKQSNGQPEETTQTESTEQTNEPTETTETKTTMNTEEKTTSQPSEIPETEGPDTTESEENKEQTHGQQLPPDPDPYATRTKERSYSTGQGQKSGQQSSKTDKKEEKKQEPQQPFGDDEKLDDIPETGPKISTDEPRVFNPDRVKRGAESYVRGYNEIILGFGKMFSKFSERKIKKLQRNKQIDIDYEETLQSGEKQTIGDFIEEHNEKVDEVLVPNPENDKIIVEALVEVMKKRGHEPSPEQVLLQEIGYDLREKTERIVELIATQRDTLDYFIESHADRMEAMNGKTEKKEEGLTPTEDVN